ncbi:MAG: S9 family peptidase [Flavobacteriales bacterium]|nr:S9 family peptidase [Flavobacteriales bacterium]
MTRTGASACALFLLSTTLGFAQKKLTLEDIWTSPKFRQDYVWGINSMKDGSNYTSMAYLSDGSKAIVQYAYKTGKAVDTLLKSTWVNPPLDFNDYGFSPDESKILVSTETEKIYRHSSMSNYYIYDRATKKASKVSEGEKLLFATFSPTGNRIAFVRQNNLFVIDLEGMLEEQITTDGTENQIINGRTDWVYEEEFAFDKGFFWSPDGNKIAFYRFDESAVPQYFFPKYEGNLYPEEYRFKYPKAGEENAKVSVLVYDLKNKKITQTGIRTSPDEYIPRVKWTHDPNLLCVYFMNRHQNELELIGYNTTTKERSSLLKETSDTYIDIDDDQYFLNDGQHFIWTSESDGYKHIYLYDMKGTKVRQITKGTWEVTSFYGIDENTQTLYYSSAEPGATERQVYSIKIDGTGKKSLTPEKGWNEASFSNGMKYFINFWSDINTPSRISLHEQSGKLIRDLETNDELKKTLSEYNLPQTEMFKFMTQTETLLNGYMIKPPNFNPDKQYPVLMYVYGGPGVQTVTNQWGGPTHLWHLYMAQQGYIVVSVDNRGTGGRGAAFKNCTYKNLGKLETEDQIEAARFLSSLTFVDKDRIGIQGWSFGGYMSSLCITKGADYFKTAIAVAPVTNWRYYDSIYTERYLQTPQENPSGYDDNSPINFVDKIKGKYLLIHGMADDNVHFQNAAEMIRAMVDKNIPFELGVYPDKNHSIYGGNTRLHLYSKMTEFLLRNL